MANPRPRRALDEVQPVHQPIEALEPVRPRRAADEPQLKPFLRPVPRSLRLSVPVAAVSAVLAGVAFLAWPQSEAVIAVPAVSAPSVSSADSLRSEQADQTTRDTVRTPLSSPTPSASTDQASAAEKKAADKTAAGKKAAEKKAQQVAADKIAADQAAKDQQAAAKKAVAELTVTGSRYATAELNLRTEASAKAAVTKVVPSGTKLAVTDTVDGGFRLVEVDNKARWVSNDYLSTDKPKESSTFSMAPCAEGSAMESGLTQDAIRVHRAVCAKFPQVTSYGGTRVADGGYHSSGRAVDCMISDSGVGWEIARWVRANAKALGVSEVIYSQKIWTVQRSSEGWRGMSDRGSATANHYDHVHVSVYGNSGTS